MNQWAVSWRLYWKRQNTEVSLSSQTAKGLWWPLKNLYLCVCNMCECRPTRALVCRGQLSGLGSLFLPQVQGPEIRSWGLCSNCCYLLSHLIGPKNFSVKWNMELKMAAMFSAQEDREPSRALHSTRPLVVTLGCEGCTEPAFIQMLEKNCRTRLHSHTLIFLPIVLWKKKKPKQNKLKIH